MYKILLIYVPKRNTPFKEAISSEMLLQIKNILSKIGYIVFLHKYIPNQIGSLIKEIDPDAIFNMAYGYVYSSENTFESQVDVLERIEAFRPRAILGSCSTTQRLVQDKLLCSEFLLKKGFKVPHHYTLGDFEDFKDNNYLVVKPRFGACHRNIRLMKPIQVKNIDNNKHLLIQNYIDGPEFTVAVVTVKGKATAFLPLEILFDETETKHVLGLNKKDCSWRIDSNDSYKLCFLAEQIFEILNLKHYARMDFRISDIGPVCIDVNPLPNLDSKRSFLPAIANLSGISYENLIKMLIDAVIHG